MKTRTFIAQVDGELPSVKEGVQARELSYRRNNVHCDQVTSVIGGFGVEIECGLVRVSSSLDLLEILQSMMRRTLVVTCKIYKPRAVLYLQCVRLVCENWKAGQQLIEDNDIIRVGHLMLHFIMIIVQNTVNSGS
jgi:hypothetical protein